MLPVRSKFIEYMGRVDIFSNLYTETVPESILNNLAKHCHHLVYADGSDIFVKSSDRYIYLIEKGKVIISDKYKKLTELGPYELFGLRNILSMNSKAESAKAFGECIIYRIPEPLIDTLLKDIKEDLRTFASNALL